jgi:Fe-Mn family superoxide dismutase
MLSSLRVVSRSIVRLPLVAARAMSTAPPSNSFKLPDLPFDYGELEPYISAAIMDVHHKKHHQAYVTNLNVAMEKLLSAQAKGDIAAAIALQPAINFNGGGHVNHSIFWTNLAPPSRGGGGQPTGDLAQAINAEFGGYAAFVEQFNARCVGVQGSGWGWLGYNTAKKRVEIATCANQDPLTSLVPLLGIDVWEHAYYLQYKNVRPDYMKAVWSVVNWSNVAERLAAAKKA